MDAQTIMEIRPALTRYLRAFSGCMGRVTNRGHLETYVAGQLGDLQRKSVEPIADAAGVPPRTLQEFLSLLRWDESAVRDRLQQQVACHHAHPDSVGVIDETSFAKKGTETACVQRQYCGSVGKKENCVISVHLGYAAGDFHTLLDGDLYLPKETWHERRHRCRAVGIPDDEVYRPKWQIALEQVCRAMYNGIRFAWLTFDEYYGGKPPFLRTLDAMGQNYVAEVPSNTRCWTKRPAVLYRRHGRDLSDELPATLVRQLRLKVRNTPPAEVRNLVQHSPILRCVPWQLYRVKDGAKGPMVWEAKSIPVWIKDEQGLPGRPYRLLVARNVLNPLEVKYFLSNAPHEAPTETLLLVAFSRWRIERMFQDSKSELGMDHFEVRRFVSIRRHLILTCVSHLFLAEFWLAHRGEKSGSDDQPSAYGHMSAGAGLESRRTLFHDPGRIDQQCAEAYTTARRPRRSQSSEENSTTPALARYQIEGCTRLQMDGVLAL